MLVDTAESVAFLALGGLSILWNYSSELSSKLEIGLDSEIQTSIVFTLVYVMTTTVLDQPFSLYKTFVIEQKHGFNKQTIGIYIADLLKQSLLLALLLPPIIFAIIKILRRSGPFVALHLWAFILLFNLFLMFIYPTVIAPLFNKVSTRTNARLSSDWFTF